MLWRMAFPLLTMIFGVLLGTALGMYITQDETRQLRDEVQASGAILAQAEAGWLSERNQLLQARDEADRAVQAALARVQDLEAQYGQAAAVVETLQRQLATCRNDKDLILSTLETDRQALASLRQSCRQESQ